MPILIYKKIRYTYDFGDGWEHKITFKYMLTFAEVKAVQVPSFFVESGCQLY
ncbi:plasmid pRiA4b ORF-3 family protein [Lactiplantibacillus nangangensis]|uniref:Plasmid pRiA4b ORF-3 family protein n=1 Tax=Lactiplantibacillus nangangensis TaxID=2559917 RepID=A0ABW1SGX6_9LACO